MLTLSKNSSFGDCISLDLCCLNDEFAKNTLTRSYLSRARIIHSDVRQQLFVDFQKSFDECAKLGLRRYAKSLFLDHLTDDFIEELKNIFINRPSLDTAIFLEEFHGKFQAQVNSAFSNREARYNLHIQAAWRSPDNDTLNINWIKSAIATLGRYARSSGSYINYNSDSNSSNVAVFPDETLERLKNVKSKIDPAAFFVGTNSDR